MIPHRLNKIAYRLIGLLLFSSHLVHAQQPSSLSIDSCYSMAKRNYPLVKQYALIEKSAAYSISNASKGYLPQLNIAGQATYQSEVTQLPISLPNITVPALSKDQYKLYGEISQPITDLFTVKHQQELVKATAGAEEQKVEVELYKLKGRVNELFFGILMLDAQIEQTELLKKDIRTGIDRTTAAIAGGIAIKSSADLLKAELLKANQRTIELKANRKGYADMLSLFINQPVADNTVLEKPAVQIGSASINRPELKMYDLQKKMVDVQTKLVSTKNIPRFNAFFQGGIGRPALNMLSNDLSSYYITGLRLNWNLTNFYTSGKEKQILTLNQHSVELQREAFLFNTNLSLKQQSAEVTKLQELIATDTDIIQLRENIKNTAKSQLENGTATTSDYLTYLNAEDLARQTQLLHQIQLLMAQYNYQTTSGN